jgi:hypothetical protein
MVKIKRNSDTGPVIPTLPMKSNMERGQTTGFVFSKLFTEQRDIAKPSEFLGQR